MTRTMNEITRYSVRRMEQATGGSMAAILLAAVGCSVLAGCTGVVARQFQPKNPNVWRFEKSLPDVRLAMERAFRRQYYRKMLYFTKDDNPSWVQNIFLDSLNRHDGVLLVLSETLGKSEVYFRNGEPLEYEADFHIHLVALSPEATLVAVRAFNMKVVEGKKWTIHGDANKYLAVAPTTIDEYEIIREIGRELGDSAMPETRRPISRQME